MYKIEIKSIMIDHAHSKTGLGNFIELTTRSLNRLKPFTKIVYGKKHGRLISRQGERL